MRNVIFKTSVLLLLLFAGRYNLHAQNAICGFDAIHNQQMKKPQYVERVNQMNAAILKKQSEIKANREFLKNANVAGGGYEIPVVVHVIYSANDANSNPSDELINDMIARLNSDFSANLGNSIPMSFKLAARAPGCGSTTGIERFNGDIFSGYANYGLSFNGSQGASESDIMNLSTWPVKEYYNIWIVRDINAGYTLPQYLAGYAYLPINQNDQTFMSFSTDGIFLNRRAVNGTNTTITHEMGHAMGLYHTFQGGDATNCPVNNDCTTDNDRVCDTRPVRSLLGPSPLPDNFQTNPCTGVNYNNEQYNFMGYGNGVNRFTQGQSERAMAALQAARGGLMVSLGSVEPPANPVINSSDVPQQIANPGNQLNIGPCNVTLQDLTYTSMGYGIDGNAYYLDHSCNIGTELLSNQTYLLQVTTQTNPQACKVWIDFNNSGSFESGELVMNSVSNSAEFTHSVSITPAKMMGAVYGTLLRMRVMSDNSSNFGPSSQLISGQTEDFWVKINDALPVTFGDIAATIKDGSLDLKWRTLTEKNNDYFIIEASKDGKAFKRIGEIKSAAPEGNSDQPVEYHFSMNMGDLSGLVAMGLLSFGLLLIVNRRKLGHWTNLILITGMITCFGISCNKAVTEEITTNKNEKIYLRIGQVDKDGTKTYSKVFQAVFE